MASPFYISIISYWLYSNNNTYNLNLLLWMVSIIYVEIFRHKGEFSGTLIQFLKEQIYPSPHKHMHTNTHSEGLHSGFNLCFHWPAVHCVSVCPFVCVYWIAVHPVFYSVNGEAVHRLFVILCLLCCACYVCFILLTGCVGYSVYWGPVHPVYSTSFLRCCSSCVIVCVVFYVYWAAVHPVCVCALYSINYGMLFTMCFII